MKVFNLKRRLKKNSRGVAVIFFVLTLGILLGFLMMVINSGMIVYQKIRLQSAVDLAAYAGASVQAHYLGADGSSDRQIASSGEESIKYLNAKIFQRYGELLNDMNFGTIVPMPMMIPNVALCTALCAAASLANGKYAAKIYKDAVSDIEGYRAKIQYILERLPEASRLAAEKTLELNIRELAIQEGLAGTLGTTTNKASDVIKQIKGSAKDDGIKRDAKNAILSFQNAKGMYLESVVAPVPHTFAYFGPLCFDASKGTTNAESWYCQMNGTGYPGTPKGFTSALLAFARVKLPIGNGNIGTLEPISGQNSHAIRLQFIQNAAKPDPFMMVSAEWYPKNGSFANLENTLGATGSLFPTKTRLVAVAAAEPFGGNLIASGGAPFGVRLQSIRRLLLDPRMSSVRTEYNGVFDYMRMFGATSSAGDPQEDAEAVIQKFLH